MTVDQIIREIETLSQEEQREILSWLQNRIEKLETTPAKITYADRNEARKIADQILTEHAELFKKLAQ